MDEQFNLLFQTLETRNVNLAEARIVDITNNFLEDLDQNDAELYILTVFNRESGILAFIKKAAAGPKGFKDLDKAIKKALELIYDLIKDFPVLVREYQDDILKICQYISRAGTYLSKTKALETIQMVFTTPKMNTSDESVNSIWMILEEKLKENTDTIYRKALVVMGALIKEKPKSITEEARRNFLERFVKSLSRYSKDKNIIDSTFKVITNFLDWTELSDDLAGILYKYMEEYCVYSQESKYNQHTKKVVNRSALDLLSQHAGLFSVQILANASTLESALKEWLSAENHDNLIAGINALDAFYKELGDVLRVRKGNAEAELLERIVDDLETQVCGKFAQSNVKRVYIRSLGYFASAVNVHLGNRVGNIFIVIKQQIEFCYELNPINELKDLENLPDYLYSLSSYISVLKEIDRNHEIALQKVAVLMVRIFPRLSPAYHTLATDTFFVTMYAVFTKSGSDKFESFLQDVIEGCIKWTCSHYVAQEVEYLLEDGSKYYTFKQFMPFWVGILNWNNIAKFRIPEEACDNLKKVFFDELMRTLFTLIQKLNIAVREKDAASNQLDLAVFLEASKKSDYNIFVNLCDLYVELMRGLKPHLFKKWVRLYLHHVMKKCNKHPYISGFYKLTTAGLKLCDQLDYFDERRLSRDDTNNCFQSLVKLVQRLLVKIREYKDDLQIACIQTILSTPISIIDKIDADFTDLYTTTFVLARSNYHFGIEALATIERWHAHKDIKPLLMKVLPFLDPILRSHSLLSKKREPTVAKSRNNFRKRKIVLVEEPELLELQRRILCLLAGMDSEVCWEYVNANVQIMPAIWSETQHLKLSLFGDGLLLYLDKLVPRVAEQALYCSDRKVRMAACELLHSITMIMLGTYREPGGNISDLNEILKTVISAILSLALDIDKTISDIFSPLSNQLMHWYASKNLLSSKQTEIVLDILLEAISNPNDAKVRDLAGSNLREFVNWSRRVKTHANYYNIGEVMNKLKYFSTHPDNSKRLGAALIFNNIYSELREEDNFINLYWLDLLRVFVLSLATMHDKTSDDCLRQVNIALNNLLRVFVERYAIFDQKVSGDKRPIPGGFAGNTTRDVAAFLLQNTKSLSTHCRLKSMEMYSKILHVEFNGKLELTQANPFRPEFHEHQLLSSGEISDCHSTDDILKWLNSLRCLIDGHIFAIDKKIPIEGNLQESKLFACLDEYLQNSARKSLRDYNLLTSVDDKFEEFEYSRELFAKRNLVLAKALLESNCTPPAYFTGNFCGFLCDCIFNHHLLALQILDYDEWDTQIERLITMLPAHIKQDFMVQAKLYLSTKFHEHRKGLLRGALFLLKVDLINPDIIELAKGSVREICSRIIQSDSIQAVHPSTLEKQNLLWQIALENPDEFVLLTKYLCDLKQMSNSETNELVQFGLHLFHTYKGVLVKFLVRRNNFEIFINELFNVARPYDFIGDFIAAVLKNSKDFNVAAGKYIVDVLVGHWDRFDGYYGEDLDRCYAGLKMVEQLAYLQGGGNPVLLKWILRTFRGHLDGGYRKDQQFDFYTQRVYTLGLLAGSEEDSRIGEALKHARSTYSDLLNKLSNKTSTTLLIKTHFEAANCSKSCDILIEALDLYISTENDYQPKIELETYFKNTENSLQADTLRRLYSSLGDDVKLVENFTVLLSVCDYEVFEGFYFEVIVDIVTKLEAGEIVEKIVSCLLLETFFCRVDIDKFEVTASGKELLKRVLLTLVKVCKEDEPESADLLKSFRMYQCRAYNTLVSMICNTETTEIIKYTLLFSRMDGNKEDILWSKLVGKECSFNFDISNNSTFSYKDVILKIRSECGGITSNKYIESQNLFASSLCEGIGKHDFTHVMIRSQTLPETQAVLTSTFHNLQIQLTNEDIDQHPCMPSVCGVIKHMADNNLLTTHDDSAPKIVDTLRNLLLKDSTHYNVKVFLVKVIDNTRMFLKEHGNWLIGPVMKVIADGSAGECINSFVLDAMEMLLTEWSDVVILENDKEHLTRLLEFLMRNVYSEFSEIFKYNLRLLQLSVEKWKNDFIVPTDFIMEKLNEPNIETEKLQIIVHIINILLVNNLEPWTGGMSKFAKKLIAILDSNHKTVYRQCAETIGLLLKYVSENEMLVSKLEVLIKVLTSAVDKISDFDKRAHCLEGLSRHYPDVCRNYLNRIVDLAMDKHMKDTRVFLRILMRCSKLCFNADELLQWLENSDDKVLVITLEMVKNFTEQAAPDQVLLVIKKVGMMLNSNISLIRSGIYDGFIAVYQRFKFEGEIGNFCKDVLLQGLVDSNAEIQERMLKFWLEIEELPQDMETRLIYLLQNIYKPEIEENYLGFSTLIMLSNLRTDVMEKLFNSPLHKCQYTPLEISTHWKVQYSSQVPLFTSSLSSQGEILATQTPQFEPTVANTLSSQKFSQIEGGSSLFIGTAEPFKNPNEYTISQKYRAFRKRFNRNKQETRKFFATQNVQKNFMERRVRVDAAKKRDMSVRIYRSYRKGDYPDIEITRIDVLKPLQELCKHDPLVARIVFTMIFDSVKCSSRGDNFLKDAALAIDGILKSSNNHTTPLMAAFLDIAIKYKDSMTFDPRVISSVAQNSRLMSLGATLLEEYLIGLDPFEEGPSKRARGINEDRESVLWIKLAELYKEMDDWDVVRTIFLDKLKCSEKALTAIGAEALGEWKNASKEYKNVILEDTDPDRRDFYFESLFRCFSELSNWSELIKHTEEIVSSENPWNALWEDEWNKQKLLPGYITAKIRDPDSNFLQQITVDLKDTVRGPYLKDNHSEQLAFLGVLQNNLSHSKVYLDTYISNFLQNWSCLNPLFSQLRGKDINAMRNPMDIYLFVNKFKTDGVCDVGDFCRYWESSSDEKSVSIVESEARNFYRKEFTKLLKEGCDDEQKRALDATSFNLDVKLMENAISRRNYYVARKYVDKSASKRPELGLKYANSNLLLSKLVRLQAEMSDDYKVVFKTLKGSMQCADTCLNHEAIKSNPMLMLDTALHLLNITTDFIKASQSEESEDYLNTILRQMNFTRKEDLRKHGEDSLLKVLSVCESSSVKPPALIKEIGKCFNKLALNACGREDVMFIHYTFKAMFYESQEAVKLLPCVLNLEGLSGDYKDVFVEKSSRIPVWMFIKWIPQLLAFVDTDKVPCITDILVKIAEQYPNSIVYAYKISKGHYKFEHHLQELSRGLCDRLDEILMNPTVEKMLFALSGVCRPDIILDTALTAMQKANHVSEEAFKRCGTNVCNGLFNELHNYYASDSMRGVHYKQVNKFRDKIQKIVTGSYNKEKIFGDIQKLKQTTSSLFPKPKNQKDLKVEHDDLGRYSPWLKHFTNDNFEQEIEIPGQYTGNGRPLLQYHVKLAGFDPDVIILSSQRKPIRIKMLGTDTKEYKFLVKYGEDLRQDQRIEQIFKLMNSILADNSLCNRQKLRVVTFEVIPLNSSIGLIEWVDDTKVLKEFITGSIPEFQCKRLERLSSEYETWISKSSLGNSSNNRRDWYSSAVQKFNNVKTVSYFKSLVNQVPEDALRRSFYNISANMESLFALKQRFIKSYSVMCLSNWLLGIGDRHLSNTLVSTNTGEVVGIDFGFAFGTATQELAVPELVPFRLTGQIVSLTLPHGISGSFKETMVHALRALRDHKEILLATMNVFILEPTMDWLEHEKLGADCVWKPQQKIAAAKSKFEGANPCEVMMDEVVNRVGDSGSLTDKYIEYLRGDVQENFRAQVEGVLNVEQQVKCLLDQATDANLLGRMYAGWEPWF